MHGLWTIALSLLFIETTADRPCAAREYQHLLESGTVCVCNATYCDDIPPVGQLDKAQIAMYLSTKDGHRLSRSTLQFATEKKKNSSHRVVVQSLNYQQTVLGFGGAFTDATGINLVAIGQDMANDIIHSYYSSDGLGYSIGRVPIASTDFSTHEYSYLDTPHDFNLTTFNLTIEDYAFKLPYIKQAIQLADTLRLFASPWSAPGWMKSNGNMRGGGKLIGDGEGPYQTTWANYFIRFFEEYAKEGVKFWGLTPQNEPTTGADKHFHWQTMYFDAGMERDFIRDYLGPALHSTNLTKDIALMIVDDQRLFYPMYPNEVLKDKEAAKYISGMALHWYENFLVPDKVLSMTHDAHPDKFILATEACNGYLPLEGKPVLGDWERADKYAYDIITDMKHWVVGWTDWNLVLDMEGGPNWVKNTVDAPIIVNPKRKEYYRQPMFYALGHFSKFVRPGFKRVGLHFPLPDTCEGIAFADTQSGRRVTVLLNRGWEEQRVSLSDSEAPSLHAHFLLPPKAIVTLVWEHPNKHL